MTFDPAPSAFQHTLIQELAWVIASPPLISGEYAGVDWWTPEQCAAEYAACLPALYELDRDPAPLLACLQQPGIYRLGRRFEVLVAYWLAISPNFQCLYSHVPIRQAKQTLGELDFIVQRCVDGAVIHLEVAVKFYLGYGDGQALHHWHGPSLKDRLDLKVTHLQQHQTQLSVHYPELVPCTVDQRACLLKGRLFYPTLDAAQAGFANASHERGVWYALPEAPTVARGAARPLRRSQWLWPQQQAVPADVPALNTLPNALAEPECFIDALNGQEQQRFFLLPVGFWNNIA